MAVVLEGGLGERFRALGDSFAVQSVRLAAPVARAGVVRAAGRGVRDWFRGVVRLPGAAAESAGSQLTMPLHVARAVRRGGAAEGRRVAAAELRGQLHRAERSLQGVADQADRAARFTPGTLPLVLASDVRRLGAGGALDRHVYESVQALPDAIAASASGGVGTAVASRRLATAQRLAEHHWARSAPSSAQARRLASDLAATERVGQFWVTARPDPRLLRELADRGVRHDPAAVVRAARAADGRIVFLERGTSRAGWQHIVEEHGHQFAVAGLRSDDLADVLVRAASSPPVAMQGTRPVHLAIAGDRVVRIAISVGENGFIVGANLG